MHYWEIIIAQVTVDSIIVFTVLIESVIFLGIVHENTNILNYLTITIMFMFLGWAAMFFGILLSTLCQDLKVANCIMMFFLSTITIMFGGGAINLRPSYKIALSILPINLPEVAVRDIMIKHYGLSDKSVLMGIGVSIAWMLIGIVFSISVLKCRKFSRNS